MSSRRLAQTWPYPRHRRFEDALRGAASRWFAERQLAVDTRHRYILARPEDWPQNIILPEVVDYILSIKQKRTAAGHGFALHDHLHNGLSSQAMLFNLIGPLIVRRDLALLEDVFGSPVEWPAGDIGAVLEYEDRTVFNEDSGQPTSIDLVLMDEAEDPFLFIECKFKESEFGSCSIFAGGDCDGRNPAGDLRLCYLHHIGRQYWNLMDKHGFLAGPLREERTCIMAAHYQYFRIVLFALEYDRPCVLLSDTRSPTFSTVGPQGRRGLMPLLLSLTPSNVQSRVLSVTVQDVVQAIRATGRHPWIAEFERKYGLAEED